MKKLALICIISLIFSLTAYANINLEDTLLRKKIGQMLIVGFNGTTLDEKNPIYDDIKNDRISGVIIFSRDASNQNTINGKKNTTKNVKSFKQLKKLISDLQAISDTKLFITIDEEGGKISRLPFLKTLSHKELGDKNDEMTTYLEAKKIAQTLKNLGVNINFAPCVDLGLNPNSKVIYQLGRAFSDDPKIVAKHANAFILAHQQFGVMTVLKHFPGHGSTSADTHKGFSDASLSWSEVELEPYRALIGGGLAQGVMISHIFNSNLDKNYPASLSKNTIGYLKRKMGFNGLIVTDDLQMNAIFDNYSLKEAIIASINAGCDLIILGNNLKYDKDSAKKFNDIVFEAVKQGEIPISRINESYQKINLIKMGLN